MQITADLSQVPNERTTIPPRAYRTRINSFTTKRSAPGKMPGNNIMLDLVVVDTNDPDLDGRGLGYNVFIPDDLKRKDALTGLKRVALSAGMTDDMLKSGINIHSLIGKTITVSVTERMYQPLDANNHPNGPARKVNDIVEVFIPGDNVNIGSPVAVSGQVHSPMDVSSVLGGTSQPPAGGSPPIPAPGQPTQSVPASA